MYALVFVGFFINGRDKKFMSGSRCHLFLFFMGT